MKTLILSILIKITLVDINTNERLPGVKVITDQNIYYSNLDGVVNMYNNEKILDISYVSYENIQQLVLKKDTTINLKQF
jgi:hypothetical protein